MGPSFEIGFTFELVHDLVVPVRRCRGANSDGDAFEGVEFSQLEESIHGVSALLADTTDAAAYFLRSAEFELLVVAVPLPCSSAGRAPDLPVRGEFAILDRQEVPSLAKNVEVRTHVFLP